MRRRQGGARGLNRDGLHFRDLLRRHRLRAGLTQESLAERAGLSPRGLSDLERGARKVPRADTLRRLAEALGLGEAERAALLSAARRARAAARPGAPAAPSPLRRLPLPVTSFIGREAELEQVSRLVQAERLVTLVGPGGVGKTRLAQEVVSRLDARQAPEVVWVDLTPTRDPRLVLTLVAEALEVRDLGGHGLHQALVRALARRQVVLLLDNVEHVLEAATEVAALLPACPGLTVLATSREPLRVPDERVYRVPPLALPGEADLPDLEQVARAPAVALFVERAQAANWSFRLQTATAGAVVELCRRLDGLPLAIELAAARSRALEPGVLLERDGRLDLLRGLRDRPGRHASLRTVLDWSYQLLSEPEQVLLRRLAVFAGGCTPEAAEAVCGHGLPPESVFDLLGRLVDRSLVVVEPGPTGARFRLLETVREYAAEQLEASGERAALRRQHAVWCLALAEQAAPHIWGPGTTTWVDRLEREHDNLRAALGWSVETAVGEEHAGSQPTPAEAGLRLGAALMLFWDLGGQLSEGRSWLDRLLSTRGTTPAPDPAWIGGFYAAGYVAFTQGDYGVAAARFQAGLDLARALDDESMQAVLLVGLGATALFTGSLEQARGFLDQSLPLAHRSGHPYALEWSLYCLGEVARTCGDFGDAQQFLRECLVVARARHNLAGAGWVLGSLGRIALAQADYTRAWDSHQESLVLRRDLDDRRGIAFSLEQLAWVAGLEGRAELAARLFGASATLHHELGVTPARNSEWRGWHERAEAAAREHLGDEGYAAAWAAGRALSRDQAIMLALTPGSAPRAARVVSAC